MGSEVPIPKVAFAPTLCFPDAEKSCFACCPPIRPAGYEHIQYEHIIKRMLRENTQSFAKRGKGVFPITGFSCWALGYLDKNCRRVGCLLHPDQNNNIDRRYRIHYGEKCGREICPEAKTFRQLNIREQNFFLQLAQDLDSFSYSSRKKNPLFKMLGWGSETLRNIAFRDCGRTFTRESFFEIYPFFLTSLNPRANAYLLRALIRRNRADFLKTKSFRHHFKIFSVRISNRLKQIIRLDPGSPYTHCLKLDPLFLDFLRLSVGLVRTDEKKALQVKHMLNAAIQ